MTRASWSAALAAVAVAAWALAAWLGGGAHVRDDVASGDDAPRPAIDAVRELALDAPVAVGGSAAPAPSSRAIVMLPDPDERGAADDVDADFEVPSDAWLVGRIVTPDARARSFARLWIGPAGEFAPWKRGFDWGDAPRTDAKGRFALAWSAELAAADALEFAVLHRDSEYAATIDTPRSHERHDLGEVRLARAPLLLRGRVVDAEGAPLPRVNVRVYRPDSRGQLAVARTDARGRFAVHARRGLARYRLATSASGYAEVQRIDVEPIEAGDIVLHRESVVRGRVLLAPELADVGLLVALRRLAAQASDDLQTATVAADGTFALRGVRAGRYRVVLTGGRWLGPELELAPVLEMAVGHAEVDLGTIDATTSVLRTVVTLHAADGSAVVGLPLSLQPAASGSELDASPNASVMAFPGSVPGTARATVVHLAPSLDVLVEGFRTAPGSFGRDGVVRLTGGDVRVELAPGLRVRVTVVGAPSPEGLIARFEREGVPFGGVYVRLAGPTFDVTLDAPGRWWVRIDAPRVPFDGPQPSATDAFAIDVRDEVELQHFAVPIGRGAIERLEEWRSTSEWPPEASGVVH